MMDRQCDSNRGYRVKSQRGTINQQRLTEQTEKLVEMQRAMELLTRTLDNQQLVDDTGKENLQVITDYTYALNLLDRYY